MDEIDEILIQHFRLGHRLYPEGRVIVTEDGETTEYTLEEWAALQNPSQS